MTTIQRAATLTTTVCSECSILYALPESFIEQRREDHKSWKCPNGHGQHFPGESDFEKERRLRKRAEQSAAFARASRDAARDQAAAAERSARALRGHLTRLRNRIAAGECPVGCHRSFANVRAHVKGQHPEWAAEHAEALS